jgi:hypothetical protein
LWWTKWNWGMFSGFVVNKVALGNVFWICGEQSGTGACFLRVLWFPLPIIQPSVPQSSSINQGWYNRPNSGWCATSPQKKAWAMNNIQNKSFKQCFSPLAKGFELTQLFYFTIMLLTILINGLYICEFVQMEQNFWYGRTVM